MFTVVITLLKKRLRFGMERFRIKSMRDIFIYFECIKLLKVLTLASFMIICFRIFFLAGHVMPKMHIQDGFS